MNSLQKNIYVMHSAFVCVFLRRRRTNIFFFNRILRRCKLSRISDFCVYVGICFTVFFYMAYMVHFWVDVSVYVQRYIVL